MSYNSLGHDGSLQKNPRALKFYSKNPGQKGKLGIQEYPMHNTSSCFWAQK